VQADVEKCDVVERLYGEPEVGREPSQHLTVEITTEKPLGADMPPSEYELGLALEESYAFRASSLTHSAAERASASAVASLRWNAETLIEVISPPRMAEKVTPTMTMVIRISGREKPASSASLPFANMTVTRS
jgi:hypothetical protein